LDESVRQSYLLCAVAIESQHVRVCRKELQAMCRPGQRRIHFANERPDRRRQLLASMTGFPLEIYFFEPSGPHVSARRSCLQDALATFADEAVVRWVMESGDAENDRDRQTASLMAEKVTWLSTIHLEHLKPFEEPLLWVPDAIGWAHGASGVGELSLYNAKPDASPSGETSGSLPQANAVGTNSIPQGGPLCQPGG
jgi:hypothetical protein